MKNTCSKKTKKSRWLTGCIFHQLGDIFFRKLRKKPGQFSKTILQSSTFSKSVFSRKFPPDTQNAMFTNKLEEFNQDSQIISVKGREHSSERFPKKTSKKSSVVVGTILTNLLDNFNQKTKSFVINFRISRIYHSFWGKTNFPFKKFLYLRRMQFCKFDGNFMPEIHKNSSSFFEIKHTNNFLSPKKVSSSEEIVWMRGIQSLKAGKNFFWEKSEISFN